MSHLNLTGTLVSGRGLFSRSVEEEALCFLRLGPKRALFRVVIPSVNKISNSRLPFTSEIKEFLSNYLNGERDSWKVLYDGLEKVSFK